MAASEDFEATYFDKRHTYIVSTARFEPFRALRLSRILPESSLAYQWRIRMHKSVPTVPPRFTCLLISLHPAIPAQASASVTLLGGQPLLRQTHRGTWGHQETLAAPRRPHQLLTVAVGPKDGGETDDTWRTKTLTELEEDVLGDRKPKVANKPISQKEVSATPGVRPAPPGKTVEFRSMLDEMDEMIFGKPKKESDEKGIMALLNKISKLLVDNTDVSPDDNVVLSAVGVILFVWLFFLGVTTGILHVPAAERFLGM